MTKSSSFLIVILTSVGMTMTASAQTDNSQFPATQISGDSLSAPLHDPQADFPGSPEKPLTRGLLLQLFALNDANQVYEAWNLLAQQNDGYAQSATRIFGDKITVEKCVVESNWKLVVSEEVKERLYFTYGKNYQRHYIEFLETNRRYPNTLEIEKLYQRTDDELGLPQSVSVDLMMNLIPTDWRRRVFFDDFSSALGIGQAAQPKLWYHYTKISAARASNESITAQDINEIQAKRLYKKAVGLIAKCMAKKLKPSAPTEDLYE